MALQRGQVLRGALPSFHDEARRLRVFIFDVFFLGTAMKVLELVAGGASTLRGADAVPNRQARGSVTDDGAVFAPDTSARREDATPMGSGFETSIVGGWSSGFVRTARIAVSGFASNPVIENQFIECGPAKVGQICEPSVRYLGCFGG